jgi:hypothetical protein
MTGRAMKSIIINFYYTAEHNDKQFHIQATSPAAAATH